ncbi:ankyrin repeat domain-containing protein [Candidatus Tisiphia endosymbiont of Nemotelus uliginosus]|uniref:ankyrin repeat domain-containing protein n=1 Tax=Candidatus Tisiphia endosymbiont of Nemotelus uliginosus TaxID=3077926 RepID=UPI0035C914D2
MAKQEHQKTIHNILIIGPGVKVDPEISKLNETNKDWLIIGDGDANKPITFEDIRERIDNVLLDKNPVFCIHAHGSRHKEGVDHRMRLDNQDPKSARNTQDFLKKLETLTDDPICVHLLSCHGGSANKAAKVLRDGSIVITYIEAKESSNTNSEHSKIKALLQRTYLTPYQQFILAFQENFEGMTFNKVESLGKITQFKTVRIPKEKEMINIINKMETTKNLTDFFNEFFDEEGKRFQAMFPEEDVTEEIKTVSTLGGQDVSKIATGILRHMCRIKRNVNIVLLDSFVKKLLSNGIDLDPEDIYGCTPLHHCAIKNGSAAMAKILIENNGNLNWQDKLGFTPLHLAIKTGNTAVAQILIENKSNLLLKNNKGNTPLHLAREDGYNIIDLLIAHDSPLTPQNDDGETPLEIIIRKGYPANRLVTTLIQYINNAPTEGEKIDRLNKKINELQPAQYGKDPELYQKVRDILENFQEEYAKQLNLPTVKATRKRQAVPSPADNLPGPSAKKSRLDTEHERNIALQQATEALLLAKDKKNDKEIAEQSEIVAELIADNASLIDKKQPNNSSGIHLISNNFGHIVQNNIIRSIDKATTYQEKLISCSNKEEEILELQAQLNLPASNVILSILQDLKQKKEQIKKDVLPTLVKESGVSEILNKPITPDTNYIRVNPGKKHTETIDR